MRPDEEWDPLQEAEQSQRERSQSGLWVDCTACHGDGFEAALIEGTSTDGEPFAEHRELPCLRCDGFGRVAAPFELVPICCADPTAAEDDWYRKRDSLDKYDFDFTSEKEPTHDE